jgi:transposase
MIVDRVISPGSKLSCSRGMKKETAQNSLAEELNPGNVDVHELYDAMDWLLERQNRIENKLAKKHLKGGSLVLFDVSSSYYTGRKSSLRQYGYSRDHRTDRPQIVYGLLCDTEGRPISVEALPGNTADPNAFNSFVQRIRKRFGINRVIFVGARGMNDRFRAHEFLYTLA